jgi:transcriptional regulator with XRE-family HTH domain
MVVDMLSQLVLRRMAQRDVSIRRLARKASLHPSTISRWLAGKRGMRVGDAERIMAQLGISYTEAPDGPANKRSLAPRDC